jgi:hypothetical protein
MDVINGNRVELEIGNIGVAAESAVSVYPTWLTSSGAVVIQPASQRSDKVGHRIWRPRITSLLLPLKACTYIPSREARFAKAIAAQLQAKLSPAEKSAIEQPPTTNLVAYSRYLRAKKLWALPTGRVPGDMREITRLLDQAVAYDPTFLFAYCELARAHATIYFWGIDRTPARVALAKAARDAALRLGRGILRLRKPESGRALLLINLFGYGGRPGSCLKSR